MTPACLAQPFRATALRAVFAYLRSLRPVANLVPQPRPPAPMP